MHVPEVCRWDAEVAEACTTSRAMHLWKIQQHYYSIYTRQMLHRGGEPSTNYSEGHA